MKHTEIEAIFTAKVTEYILKGYIINANTMSGHQGEVVKVDLRKGDDLIRIMLDDTAEWDDDHRRELVTLTVGRSIEQIRDDGPFSTMGRTFWNNKQEIIEERKFYLIDNRADYYIEDVEAYDAMKHKHYQRYRNRDDRRGRRELPEAARMIAKRFIKRTTGKARVNSKEIKVIKLDATKTDRPVYYAEYRGKTYKIG